MLAAKFIRFSVALIVFIAFIHFASSRKIVLQLESVFTEITVDTAAIGSNPATRPLDLRELALNIPDSLLPFCRGLKSNREIALSFDACPTGGKNQFSRTIFNTLVKTGTPATIFLSGYWVKEDSSATRLLASDSLIELANHSYSHPHLTHLTAAKIKEELKRTQDIISNLTGRRPFLFRAPYGEYNDTLINIARQLGLVTVQFDVESGDPDTAFSADRLITWVTKEARNGSVIIMHINNRGWHTAEALPSIIADLRTKGFRFVTVSDLLKQVVEQDKSDSLKADGTGTLQHNQK
jgi:peptidoglycan/xylan/chitin deacetylase (PgdA/CDA1 family)